MEYDVRITVIREITVPVRAENMQQAKAIARQNWSDHVYDSAETHSRRQRESASFEALYPDYPHIGVVINIQPTSKIGRAHV